MLRLFVNLSGGVSVGGQEENVGRFQNSWGLEGYG